MANIHWTTALLSKMWRAVSSPVRGLCLFVRQKIKWHGIVRFTRKAHIAQESTLEGANSIGDGTYFSGTMGYGTYICDNCRINAKIGRFCSIGNEVRTAGGTHPYTTPFATTSPMFYSLWKQAMITFAKKQMYDELLLPVVIGNDVWIGDRAYIVGGHCIGDGAIILSGAVVTKDIPPYAIVGGVPATIIRFRYDQKTIQWLQNIQWWNKSLDWLRANSELLCDLGKLKIALDTE